MEKERNLICNSHYQALPDLSKPTLLFQLNDHSVYWLGIIEESAFRCNSYLIRDGDQAFIVDPGGTNHFEQVFNRVRQIMEPENVSALILCHQDPDVAGSMADWLSFKPQIEIFSTPRTHVLLPHYGEGSYNAVDVEQNPEITLSSGRRLLFRPAPFLHFPGAFVTYDEASGFLFSGDIWAALDIEWKLVVNDFTQHVTRMDLFHKDYMASNLAARGFVNSIEDLEISAILPQHGSIISSRDVSRALDYLKNLECGIDLIYATENMLESLSNTLDERGETAIYTPDSLEVEIPSGHPEAGTQRETVMLRQSLFQASRLAALKDKALKELRAAEARIQHSETHLAEAQKIARLGHWDWDIDTNRLTWSDEIYRIFGLSNGSEISYDLFLDTIHPDDRHRVEDAVRRALDEMLPYDIDHRIVLPDGQLRFVHEQAKVTRDESGRPTRMFGTVQDITARKKTEEALKESHDLIEMIDHFRSEFIEHSDPFALYDRLLKDLLELTRSRYGFIAETEETPDGSPFLRAYAITNLSWDETSRKLYEEYRKKGFEFRKLDNLFGHVVTSGEAVISNDPENDPRRAGLPKGHPRIDAFLGIPVYYGERLVGEIGLANRDGGYDVAMLKNIEPVIAACGQIIVARQERDARQIAEEKLAAMATLDFLTNIPNRRRFDDYLLQEWQRAARSKQPISLIMIDIDHFKLYNDHYGHQAGDTCLKKVAELIETSMQRPADLAARYGGEEFVCILPETSHD
ncbi:MAG: diguanylate cyclase, partial [Sulfurimonadaceae bacterium]|nr:diguanylate cyclase [Sulfurimonadaceae bacterium]